MVVDKKRLTARVTVGAVAVCCLLLAVQAGVNAQAQRIVSLVPAVTEMLFAIGAGPRIVAVSSFDDFPPEVASLPRVGALLDPDIERILALRPDLVVTYGSQATVQAQLTRSRVGIFDYRHAGLAGIFETMQRLGSVTGRQADAESLVASLRAQLDRIRASVAGRPAPRTLLVFERDRGALRGIYVSGGRGFLHEMLEIAGGRNVFADADREAVQPSHEMLLARAPEVIIELRAGAAPPPDVAAAERRLWNTLPSIPAVRSGRIYSLHGDHLLVPGPRVGAAAESFARTLHPDAFR